MTSWDERFCTGSYPRDPDPSPVLKAYVNTFPDGRALDVATGTGRNAVFLAERGYDVDAIDQSREGLQIAERNALERGVEDDCNWLQADAAAFEYPEAEYDVITISFFRTLDRLTDVNAALKPDGVLFYQHHLRSSDSVDVGPSTDRYRFAANELLHACLDLTVLYYEETTEIEDDRAAARVLVIARNSTGGNKPIRWRPGPRSSVGRGTGSRGRSLDCPAFPRVAEPLTVRRSSSSGVGRPGCVNRHGRWNARHLLSRAYKQGRWPATPAPPERSSTSCSGATRSWRRCIG